MAWNALNIIWNWSCFGSGGVLGSNSIFPVVSLSLLLMSNTKCTNQQYWYKNVLSNNVTDTSKHKIKKNMYTYLNLYNNNLQSLNQKIMDR